MSYITSKLNKYYNYDVQWLNENDLDLNYQLTAFTYEAQSYPSLSVNLFLYV